MRVVPLAGRQRRRHVTGTRLEVRRVGEGLAEEAKAFEADRSRRFEREEGGVLVRLVIALELVGRAVRLRGGVLLHRFYL